MKYLKYVALPAFMFFSILHAQISTQDINSFFDKKSDPKVLRYQKILKEASEQCFLIYMFNGSDKQSTDCAAVVKQFADLYGWKIVGITLDGKKIEGFDEMREDNGISKSFDISIGSPAVALVNPEKNEFHLISCGNVSLNQMEEGIMKKFEQTRTTN